MESSLDALSTVRQFRDVAVSEDGHLAAWIESGQRNAASDSRGAAVYVKDLRDAAAAPRRVGEPAENIQGLSWSLDGKLAFLSDADGPGQLELYVAERPGHSKPRKVTDVTGFLEGPQWSPDGRSVALLRIESSTRIPGPTEATKPDSGVVAESFAEQRLAIVNPADGAMRWLSPANMYAYEFDWSPDSKELVYLAAPGSGDDNWFIAEVYRVDATTGVARKILKPSMQVANIRWSPDGKSVAFIGGLMSDQGVTGGDIYAMPAEGGAPRDLTPNRKSSPNWFRWMPSSSQILMTENVSGDMAITSLDLGTLTTETLWKGAETIRFSGDATTSAVVRNSFTQAPEVWAGPTGRWQQLTHTNASAHPEWGEAKSVEWTNDGFHIQGWLVLPQPYDPAKRYPMIVDVHGGPASMTHAAWPRPGLALQLLSTQGYFVFEPNPRGSYGEGEAFTRANVKDFGYGDLRDILAGVDTVTKNYPVDEKRIGIAGWSYGGYMTMWTVTQTNRFRAAFAGAGIANWQSYYGENGIDQWMIPYFGASVYDDPAVYAKSSPINFIKNVKTPTLIVVGDRDAECPPPQSYEFWHALKTLNVKTEFVLYPGEGHGFHDPKHSRDVFERLTQWFQDNMPAEKP